MLRGIRKAAPLLQDFMAERLSAYGIPAAKAALLGFSQGTMMSLYVAPRYPQRLAGVLGYSGALVWESEIDTNALQKIPVHLIHGEQDNVVPVMAYHQARATLEHYDFPVSGMTQPYVMHGIDPAGIQSGATFLQSVLT